MNLTILSKGLQLDPLPENLGRNSDYPHAPKRHPNFNDKEFDLALDNALRYFPTKYHQILRGEFLQELEQYGHIYMYRFKPVNRELLRAYPIDNYPCQLKVAAAIMLMISNNLDPDIAQYPDELVTYGGNGQVFSNWAQFWIIMKYLSKMNNKQCLVMYSGHPMGLFPTNPLFCSPKMVITNGMMVPEYSKIENYDKLFGLGVTMYGQMTAGSYCYIGPQGIVHGTTITVMNAMRKRSSSTSAQKKKVFLTSGLGGMSGAQAKAAVISDCIGVVAEISEKALMKRYNQGWVEQISHNVQDCIDKIKQYRSNNKSTSIGYLGNVVDLWESIVKYHKSSGELLIDLGSDQTSCHIINDGGYFPVGLSYEESLDLMSKNKDQFQKLIDKSLIRHVEAINYLSDKGMFFFDYGNAFLMQAGKVGAKVFKDDTSAKCGTVDNQFRYPSYVQDIMGDVFSMGFGPFRWICASGEEEDLKATDEKSIEMFKELITELNELERSGKFDKEYLNEVRQQYQDNLNWITNAGSHKLVVGSKARILYADAKGRVKLAKAFNAMIREGKLSGEVILSRDHHDVSGTDSPFRETSNVEDGSAVCADMSVQNAIGDSFRGASWVALHNGGGVGWGQVTNGGFGLVLDGSEEADSRAESMLGWDVTNGLSRRMWAGNSYAKRTVQRLMDEVDNLEVFVPHTTI